MFSTYVLAGIGFFLAGLDGTATGALHVVTLLNVGLVGVVSFLRHVVFARSDAARMGWGDEGASNFQLEVGFANLAVGLVALLAWAGDWGVAAEVVGMLLGISLMAVGLLAVAILGADAASPAPF